MLCGVGAMAPGFFLSVMATPAQLRRTPDPQNDCSHACSPLRANLRRHEPDDGGRYKHVSGVSDPCSARPPITAGYTLNR